MVSDKKNVDDMNNPDDGKSRQQEKLRNRDLASSLHDNHTKDFETLSALR